MTSAIGLTEVQERGIAARNGDVGDFSHAVHDWVMEPYQDAWAMALEEENRVVIICPPDTRKTSTVQSFIEQTIGKNPDVRILWLMKAGIQAETTVMAVAETIEFNLVFQEAFPECVPNFDAKWNKTMLYVKRKRPGRDPTLMGCGFNGPYQGLHFDIIVIDDPTNQEDVFSPTTMNMQRNKLRGVIMDRLDDGGRIIAILTRWGEEDLVPTLRELKFKVVTMPIMAEYPWGGGELIPISPTRWTISDLMRMREEKTEALFDLTYMCDPFAAEGGIIRRHHIHYWDRGNLPTGNTVTLMAVDPAASLQTRADPSGIATGVLELRTRTLYITEVYRKRMEVMELENAISVRAKGLARLVAVGLETKGFQLTLFQRMRREKRLPIMELPYRTKVQARLKAKGLDNDKTSRAYAVAQCLANGSTLLAHNLGYHDGVSVESELCGFPNMKHDECVDLVAFLRAMADCYVPAKTRVRMSAG